MVEPLFMPSDSVESQLYMVDMQLASGQSERIDGEGSTYAFRLGLNEADNYFFESFERPSRFKL
jgi:hypothetical protein